MGWNFTLILVDSTADDFDDNESNLQFQRYDVLTNCLNPRRLCIGVKENTTFISLESLFWKNLDDSQNYSPLESDLVNIFPKGRILICRLFNTVNGAFYSYIQDSQKIRTKGVINGQLALDCDHLTILEEKVYTKYINLCGPDVRADIEKQLAKFENEVLRKKAFLEFLSRKSITKDFDYLNGSLDEVSIFMYATLILGEEMDKMDLSKIRMVRYNKSKFDFRKESLKSFVVDATKRLSVTQKDSQG
jgi:hypothetical protein